MSRHSKSFIEPELTDYLGVTWAETGVELGNCVGSYPGLVDIPFIGGQTYNDVFLTTVGAWSTLLFTDTQGVGGARGTGVHAHPEGGGAHRPDGGRLVVLVGRPYRMDHAALRGNVEYVLSHFFGEPFDPTAAPEPGEAVQLRLSPGRPNPFGAETVLSFGLPQPGPVHLAVFDAAGRRVRTLVAGEMPAGPQEVVWDGTDDSGRDLASGAYFARLESGGTVRLQSLVIIK
jgi:hypothetical protein